LTLHVAAFSLFNERSLSKHGNTRVAPAVSSYFHLVFESAGCGAICDSSDILA